MSKKIDSFFVPKKSKLLSQANNEPQAEVDTGVVVVAVGAERPSGPDTVAVGLVWYFNVVFQ